MLFDSACSAQSCTKFCAYTPLNNASVTMPCSLYSSTPMTFNFSATDRAFAKWSLGCCRPGDLGSICAEASRRWISSSACLAAAMRRMYSPSQIWSGLRSRSSCKQATLGSDALRALTASRLISLGGVAGPLIQLKWGLARAGLLVSNLLCN